MKPISQRPIPFSDRGFSLVEVMIVAALMSVFAFGLSDLIVGMQREGRALTENLASKDLAQGLIRALSSGNTCTYITNNPTSLTFNSTAVSTTSPQIITPSLPIYATVSPAPGAVVAQIGQQASAFSPTLFISNIQLEISNGMGSSYTGNWVISFDQTKLVHPIKPIKIQTIINADITTPTAALIQSCSSGITLTQDPAKCVWLNWGSKNQGGSAPDLESAYCPLGMYAAGIKGTGVSTGAKRDFGKIYCCPP